MRWAFCRWPKWISHSISICGVALWAFVLVAPAALLAAAMLTILAAFAKSFREAQSYMGLVILVPMIPSFWILIDPTRTETWMTLVPLLSQNVLILELVRGEPVNLTWFALSMGTTGVAALILAAVAGTLYKPAEVDFYVGVKGGRRGEGEKGRRGEG